MELKIEYVKKEDLKPYANNAKIHTTEQIEQIKRSIEEFGFNDPVAVWHDNEIIEGHGRLMAVMDMDDITDVPIIRLDDLTNEERKAYMLVHNKLTMNTDFDSDLLDIELDDILNIDMTDFGFELALDDEPKEVVEDELPKEVETRCKLGNLWQLGEHRLICGDSTDIAVIDRLMDGVKCDVAFTSPPYNVGKSATLNGNTHMTECKYVNGDDDLSNYDELLQKSTENMLANAEYVFVNLQMLSNNKKIIVEWMHNYKDELCDVAIWYKSSTAPAMARRVMNSQFEFVFVFSRSNNSRAIGTKDFRGTVSNVYQGSAQRKNEYAEIHSATFPMEFVSHFILNFTNENNLVLDVFGGTGTTLIACEQLDRKCYMAELDPHYCDVIIQRWENFTGEKAIKL